MPVSKKEIPKFKCLRCGKVKQQGKDASRPEFYESDSELYSNLKSLPICKNCVEKLYAEQLDKYSDIKKAIEVLCIKLDIYYDENLIASAIDEAKIRNSNAFRIYVVRVNSLQQYKSRRTFDFDNYFQNKKVVVDEVTKPKKIKVNDNDKRNKDDVIRILGYEPYRNESEEDQVFLYNNLSDYLDASTQDDGFKRASCINIVKMFMQVEKIDNIIKKHLILADNDPSAIGEINTLSNARAKLTAQIISIAKDNGISLNHSNDKSKGGGTLSGIIKEMTGRNLDAVNVNLFDIETAKGMKQVADLSNESIIKQIMLDENDYTEMIKEQREIIKNIEERYKEMLEKYRLLKLEYNKQNNIEEVFEDQITEDEEGDDE